MSKTALVTGATGVIGSQLCRELNDRGWRVTAIRRKSSNTDRLSDVPLGWETADIRDRSALEAAVDGQDHVFHLAGIGLLDGDEEMVWSVNVEGTQNVVAACERSDVGRLLFTSTAGLYRNGTVACESDRTEPLGVYQRSKDRAEQLINDSLVESVTVHPTSVFAPGDTSFTARLIQLATNPKMVAYLPGGASIVCVEDVVNGITSAMIQGEEGENYILGGENLTYQDALGVISRYAGSRPPTIKIPRSVVRAMGPVVGRINRRLGTTIFPVNADMARLSTQHLFYSSYKAENSLDYSTRPFEAFVDDALNWYLQSVA